MKIILEDISRKLKARELHEVRDDLLSQEPSEVAEIISELVLEESIVVFRILPKSFAADIFENLNLEKQTEILNTLGNSRTEVLLNEMAADDRTALFEEIPTSAVRRLLNLLNPEERTIALTLLGYPESSVGRFMTPEYVAVKQSWDIKQVLEHIRNFGPKSETLESIFVVDDDGKLLGQVRIRLILLSEPNALVSEIVREPVEVLSAYSDQEESVKVFMKYGQTVLPVVDSEELLIGIVTIDDVLSIASEEATEDIQKFGGIEALNEPYLKAPFHRIVRSRASWLVLLFLGEMLTATAMAAYEDQLQEIVVLAIFLPLIISSGGNSGSQAATLVIRALSIGEIALKDWYKILTREVCSGIILGGLLGFVGFIKIWVWAKVFGSYGAEWFPLGITVAFSLIFVVLWGTISGAMFPLLLKRLGADPATSSAPFVATVVDVVGLILYFTTASYAFMYFL